MSSLVLRVSHREPEPREEPAPTGFVWVERGESRAFLLTPDEIDPARRYPLVTVLHGAGRQDEGLAKVLRDEPQRRQAMFLIPRSTHPLSNPRLFSAVMGWAAGFRVVDPSGLRPDDPKPRLLLEYGTHDPVFPFERVAVPMREDLERRGYSLTFRVDEGGKHWPSSDFLSEALDWFLGS
jgi:predicted esterase